MERDEYTNWDDAYNNMKAIPNSAQYPEIWAKRAERYRLTHPNAQLGIAYGENERQKLDIFYPSDAFKGLAIFIHGGYWMRMDRSHWSHLAAGACANGYTVAIPSYDLTPEVRISDITKMIGVSIQKAAERVSGDLFLAGHSAGGHLVTRMMCEDSPLPSDTLRRIRNVLSISGLHDLRPLLKTAMNQTLGLDETEAVIESSALHKPMGDAKVTTLVGGGELPEFHRQAVILEKNWSKLGRTIRYVPDENFNHFTVLDALENDSSPITRAFLGQD